MLEAVIFDLGGVLILNGRPSDAARQYPDADPDLVTATIMGPPGEDGDHPWHRLERGEITFAENRRLNREALQAAGIAIPPPPPDSGPAEIAWPLNEPVVQLVRDLKAAGIRLGVLTNNVAEFKDSWRAMLPFDELFDDVVDSHEVGLRKPNPAIYQLALARLGADAGRTAFLDDVSSNVTAAQGVGMLAVLVDEDPTPAVATVRAWAGLD